MTKPIETLEGADALAFKAAIKPFLMAILGDENFKSATYIDEQLAAAEAVLDEKVIEAGTILDGTARFGTFETLLPGTRLVLLDPDGRVLAELPDSRIPEVVAALQAQASDIDALQLTSTGSTQFETLAKAEYQFLLLDADGRVVYSAPDPRVSALTLTALTGVMFETTDNAVSINLLDSGGGIIAPIARAGQSSPEVIAARGNLATLSSRLANVISADGYAIDDAFGRDWLRNTHRLLTRLDPDLGAEAVLCAIGVGGDSYGHNRSRYTERLAKKLVARFGDGGAGWIGFGFLQSGNVAPWSTPNQPSFLNGCIRSQYVVRHFGSAVGTYYSTAMPDLALATLSTNGDAIEVTFPAAHPNTSCVLLFRAVAGASIRHTRDAGATWTNVALDGSAGTQIAGVHYAVPIAMPAGAGTLRIERVAGNCELGGLYAKGGQGVLISKFAATGSRLAQWQTAPSDWDAIMSYFDLDCFLYMDGPNSQLSNVTATTWGASLSAFITRLRALANAPEPFIMMPPENQLGSAIKMKDIAAEALRVCRLRQVTYRNTQPLFGDPDNPAAYQFPDSLHPDAVTQGPSLVRASYSTIIPF